MKCVAAWILAALKAPDDAAAIGRIRAEVTELAEQFPVPSARVEAVAR